MEDEPSALSRTRVRFTGQRTNTHIIDNVRRKSVHACVGECVYMRVWRGRGFASLEVSKHSWTNSSL